MKKIVIAFLVAVILTTVVAGIILGIIVLCNYIGFMAFYFSFIAVVLLGFLTCVAYVYLENHEPNWWPEK